MPRKKSWTRKGPKHRKKTMFLNGASKKHRKLQGLSWERGDPGVGTLRSAAGAARHYNLRLPIRATATRPCPCRRPSVVTEGYRGVPPQPPPQLGVTPSPPRRDPVVTSAVSVTAMGESISKANVGEHGVNIGQHKDNLGQHGTNIGYHKANIGAR